MIGLVRIPTLFRYSTNNLKQNRIFKEITGNDIKFIYQSIVKEFHSSNVLSRKKTEEEKEAEKKGRRVLRYSQKSKTKSEIISIWKNMTVADIAKALNKSLDHVFEAMVYVNDSENYKFPKSVIDNPQVIKDIVKISGCKFKLISKPSDVEENIEIEIKDVFRSPPAPIENLKHRPPVVTVMGHVDHGKTTLLDSLRNTNVVEGEFGGITQHIGAFSVRLSNEGLVTFLDTPGHAAFTAMRARGANVTDMVVLVVAADDGVMEQTVESIRMAKEAQVPIIVAINKIDKAGADIERTKKMLSIHGIVVEDLGGDTQAIPVSALKGTNLDTLVEAIDLQSQLMGLTADYTGLVEGVVVEAETDVSRGKLATVIIQRGTLRKGCILVAGMGWARTRIMFSPDGTPISEAPPSTPVQILGWRELPSAGDEVIEVTSEKKAAEVMRWRSNERMTEKQILDSKVISEKQAQHRSVYEEMLKRKRLLGRYKMKPEGPRQKLFADSNEPTLSVILKGDVDGSVEAILNVLETYDDHKNCKLDIVHYGVGNVTENDIEFAETFDGVIYAFNLPRANYTPNITTMLKRKNISIKNLNIIYKLIDDIKEELNLRVPVSKEESILGEANVLQNFQVNEKRKKVFVAGCRCVKGVLKKSAFYRVLRNEEILFEGKLDSMRHHKNEVDSIKTDVECGLMFINNKIEFDQGDTVICYELIDVKHKIEWDPGF